MQVSAADKVTGKVNKITITNDKGRLSKEEVEKMVQEAKDMEEFDKIAKERVDAKNGLEQYAYSIKQTLGEDSVKSKLTDDDVKILEEACNKATSYVELNSEASKEDYDNEKKTLESVAMPIMGKIYGQEQSDQEAGQPQGGGPTVEDFDID